MLSDVDGRILVKLARKTVEKSFKNGKLIVEETTFNQKRGVFVSIHTYHGHELRGCIGYIHSDLSLGEALQRASFSAAFEDPRFPSLKENELVHIVFEVSVLTKPELVKVKNPKEYPKKIEIGKNGLIVEHGIFKGILLPQVPLRFKWDARTFLDHACMKSGLTPDMWFDPKTKIYKFQAQVFKETKPNGKVIRTSMQKH